MDPGHHHNALPKGDELHWYRVERILGQGGFGITYLAIDTNLDQEVAIKEYLPSELATRDQSNTVQPISEDHSKMYHWGLDRFLDEARTLVKFKHLNIVRVQSFFEQHNTAYMVMEYEKGESFADILQNDQVRTEKRLREILMPILSGLAVVHAAGFVHRDIKPANIFVREDGSPVLLDFGSARQAIGGRTRTLTSLVTPGFAPFEQYHDTEGKQGPWTDIYALGATCYRAITGNNPVEALKRGMARINHSTDPYLALSDLRAGDFSETFLEAIDCALRFREQDRPQSVQDWVEMLDGRMPVPPALEPQGPTALPDGSTQRIEPTQKTRQTEPTQELGAPSARNLDPTTPAPQTVPPVASQAPTTGGTVADTRPPATPSRAPLWIGGIAVIGISVAAAVFVPRLLEQPRQSDPATATAPAAPSAEETTEQLVNELLRAARIDIEAGRVVTPESDNALDRYRRILAIDPDNVGARQGLRDIVDRQVAAANTAIGNGDMAAARERLDIAKSIDPNAVGVLLVEEKFTQRRNELRLQQVQQHLAEAATAMAASRYEAAGRAYGEILKLDPGNQAASTGLAEIDRLAASKAQAQREDAARTQRIAGLLASAQQHEAGGRLQESLSDYQSVLALAPGNAEARSGAAGVQRKQTVRARERRVGELLAAADKATGAERYSDALAAYARVLELDPGNATASGEDARIRSLMAEQSQRQRIETILAGARQKTAQRQYQRAEQDYRQVLQLEPGNAAAQAGLTDLSRLRAEQRQRHLDSLLAKADQATTDKRYDEAEDGYGEVLRLDPENARATRGLAAIQNTRSSQARQQRIDAALASAAGAAKAKRYAAAEQGYQDVLKIDPGNSAARNGLAEVKRRRDASARENRIKSLLASAAGATSLRAREKAYNDVLKLDPNNRTARRELDKIGKQRTARDQQNQVTALLASASAALQAGRLNDSEKAFADALKLDSANAKARRGLNDVKTRRAAGNKTSRITALLASGNEALRAGRLNDAEKAYRDVLKLDSVNSKAKHGLAGVKTKRSGESRQNRVAGLLASGNKALSAGRLNDAEKAYRDVLKLDSVNSKAKHGLANVKKQRAARKAGTDRINAHLTSARKHRNAKRYAQAEQQFRAVLTLDPNNAQAKAGLRQLAKLTAPASASSKKKAAAGTRQLAVLPWTMTGTQEHVESIFAGLNQALEQRSGSLRLAYSHYREYPLARKSKKVSGSLSSKELKSVWKKKGFFSTPEVDEQRALAAAKKLGVDSVLMASISLVAERATMEVYLIDLTSGKVRKAKQKIHFPIWGYDPQAANKVASLVLQVLPN